MRIVGTLVATAAVLAAAAPAATARTTPVADGSGATALSAYGGHLVWSQLERGSRRWRLMHWHAGRLSRLPVPSRAVPFDADTGPDADGHPVVAFSQCQKDPKAQSQPDWLHARGCHVEQMRLDVADSPHLIAGADAPGSSATNPSPWHGGLAFVRHADGAFSSHLLVLRAGVTTPAPLPDGPVACEIDCDDRRILTTVESLDLGPSAAAFVWRQDGGDTVGISSEWTLRVDPLDGSKPADLSDGWIDGACGFVYPVAPSALGRGAFWVATGSPCDRTEAVFAHVDPTANVRRQARSGSGLIFAAARDGATTYWLRAPHSLSTRFPDSLACAGRRVHCEIVRSTSLPWRTLRPREPLGPHPEDD